MNPTLLTLSVIFPLYLLQVFGLIEKYVFSDWNFIGYILVAIMLDTFLGIMVAVKRRRIHSFKLRSICQKLGYYMIALVAVHVLANHQVDGEQNQIFNLVAPFFKGGMYFLLLGAEALSIDENCKNAFGKGFLPTFITQRMLEYRETGKINDSDIIPKQVENGL